ncbi:WS/DGAT domain-containing protein [Marinobacteraceae bacterium S3BR75-40.1]
MRGDEASLLSPVDVAWLSMDHATNPMMITALLRVEGLRAADFRSFLQAYWLQWQRFRARPVMRGATWWWETDPTFALDRHLEVVAPALPSPEALQTWVSERLNEPLPNHHPRWKFWYVPLEGEAPAILLRIHHCYADGLSLVGVFRNLTTAAPEEHPDPASTGVHELRHQWMQASWAWLQRQVRLSSGEGSGGGGVGKGLESWAETGLRFVNELTDYLLEEMDSPTPLRGALTGRKQCCWSEPVPLERFKAIARSTGSKVNDVLLACVAYALRQQLERAGQSLQDLILHAAVPVDLRAMLPDSLQPDSGMLGNLFGTVFVPLPVDAETGLEQLFRIKHETRRLKHSWQPGISWGLLCSAGLMPRQWQEPLTRLFSRKASAVVSNVPGSGEQRYLAGCPVREQMFWVPQAGDIGLGVSIISYAGQVQFGIKADEGVLPDPLAFRDDCLAALEPLERLL